jgi:hypothetical protein
MNKDKIVAKVLKKLSKIELSKDEISLLNDLLDGPLVRKLMDPEEIKTALNLVKKGLVHKGTSPDRQQSVQFSILNEIRVKDLLKEYE